MEFKYNYRPSASDLWKLSLSGIYRSMIGLSNVLFTFAVLFLAIRFWSDVGTGRKIALILAILLFTLIQPWILYRRAQKQVKQAPNQVELLFNDRGLKVKSTEATSQLKWQQIRVINKPSMLVVYTDKNQGYLLNNELLGEDKPRLYDFITSKTKK